MKQIAQNQADRKAKLEEQAKLGGKAGVVAKNQLSNIKKE